MSENPISGVAGIIGSGLLAEDKRMSLIASNMANADSIAAPGAEPYRAVEPVFAALPLDATDGNGDPSGLGALPAFGDPGDPPGAASVDVIETLPSAAPPKTVYDPGNPYADANGYVRESNVSEVQQMVDMIGASRSYAAQVAVLDAHERTETMIVQSFIA